MNTCGGRIRSLRELVTVAALMSGNAVVAQTAGPSVLPPLPPPMPTVDRSGIDRTNGTLANPPYQAIEIGNEISGLGVVDKGYP